ncbi:MAG TPA: lysophospholipid acyltransferase family protein [Deltaproteobacteria bacterium]|nr:lysophospholipid acyltransferase family protein [Deltaproteobacteria bacterium]HPJ92668.1 lysophospholipid acyltransferase family protein [Deltaproteobacteria bacterium]
MSSLLKAALTSEPFHTFLYRFIRVYSSTFRFSVVNEKPWMEYLQQGGHVLICTWHQQFFSAIRYFKAYERYTPPLMISRSSDGTIIAGVARRTGWNPVLGSSSRGGAEALKGMIKCFRLSRLAAHVVDGPRGPAGKIKAGVIRLAHAADAVIVPFFTEADRAWYINSWDNFLLPKPFSRVTLTYGDMLRFNPTTDPQEFEGQRAKLEKIMIPGLKGRLAA